MLRDDDIDPTGEDLRIHVKSVADWSDPAILGAVGAALDDHPELKPQHWGKRDPPEHAVDGKFADVLRASAVRFVDPDENFIQTARVRSDQGPQVLGVIRGDVVRSGVPPLRGFECVLGHAHNYLDMGVEQRWFDGDAATEHLARVSKAFTRLCEAADAFQGWIEPSQHGRQRDALRSKGYAEGTIPPWKSDPKAHHLPDSHELPDVFWMQYYGPSFVAHWGDSVVDRLGIRRERTANGGVVVWATETPFTFDPAADRLDSYEWKRSFYEVLGNDAILHEGFVRRPPGELVPTYDDHVRHLR